MSGTVLLNDDPFTATDNGDSDMDEAEYIATRLTAGDATDGSGVLTISSMCLESLPCQHGVFINGVEQSDTWNAKKIYRWCRAHGATLPGHIADFARRYPHRV